MRHYVGISPSGPCTLYNVRRGPTGEPQLLMDENEQKTLRLNYADWLEGSETIASITTTTHGCTVIATLATPNVNLVISAATSRDEHGEVEVLATSSAGDKHRQVIKVRRVQRYGDERTYLDYR